MGSGEQIDVFWDPWIPRGVTRRPSTPNEAEITKTVSDLIDQDSVTWNEDLVRQIFQQDDVKVILSIPLRLDMEIG